MQSCGEVPLVVWKLSAAVGFPHLDGGPILRVRQANQEDDDESNFPSPFISLDEGEVNEGQEFFFPFSLLLPFLSIQRVSTQS